MIRLVVSGCCGRMGSLIVEEALRMPGSFELVGALEQEGHPQIGRPLAGCPRVKVSGDSKGLLAQADLLIEFTTPEATLANAMSAAEAQVPMVIGTTGFPPGQFEQLKTISSRIPIFWSPNMSLPVFFLRRALRFLCRDLKGLGASDLLTKVSITETHHIQKKDKPSGTAKQLAEDISETLGIPTGLIEIESIREGTVVGIHTVNFDFGLDHLTWGHEAKNRKIFALSALFAADRFIKKFQGRPGFYGMEDIWVAA